MNVKRAPITTLCVVLSVLFYSLDLSSWAGQYKWIEVAAQSASGPDPITSHLPIFLSLCSLLSAVFFYVLFERYSATQCLCPPHEVASLPLWSNTTTSTTNTTTEGKQSPTTTSLRMMTINMLLRPPFINYNGDDYKNERVDLLVRHVLPHYDIVALQEVFWFWNFRLSKLIKAAQAMGFHWYTNNAAPPMSSRKFIDGGLLILSRYPITETRRHIYTNGVQIDGWAAKQALCAKVHISPTTHIHVITTHTQADYASNASNTRNASTRMTQIQEIGELIHEIWKEDPQRGDVVVMGDLNVDGRAHDSDELRLAKRDKWGAWGEEDRDSDEYAVMMETFNRSVRGQKLDEDAVDVGKEKQCESDKSAKKLPRIAITDLLRKAHKGINPVTIGDVNVLVDGSLAPRETTLTDPVTDMMARQCLDYMIHFEYEHDTVKKATGRRQHLEVVQSQVEPFFMDKRQVGGLPVTQLSDHYGLSSTFALLPEET